MTNQQTTFQQPIDFGRLLRPVFRYWYLLVLSVLISLMIAFIYLRNARPVYEMQTTILIRNNEEDGLTKDALQKEILGMGTDPKIYEDVRIFRSRACMEAIVDSLQLQYRLVKMGQFGEEDLYNNSPLDLSTLRTPDRSKNYELEILNRSSYRIQIDESDRLQGFFGAPLNTDEGTFLLELKDETFADLDTSASYVLKTQSTETSARSYLGAFVVEYDEDQPTILDLYIQDEVPQRGLDILQEAVQTYNSLTLRDKSRKRRNTLDFIEERIDVLVAELNQVERDMERYKTNESLSIDYKHDLPYVQERIGYFEREMVDAEIQQNKMQYIAETLDSNEYQFFPLVDVGLDQKGLSGLITAYNELILERSKLRQTVTENYPSIQLVDEKIESLKISIQEEVTKNLRQLEARIVELRDKNQAYLAELNATPRRERELVNRQRQQVTKENLYKYLLEKREEAAVSIAAVGENASIIDPPFVNGQVSPQRSSILLGAGLAGIFLPFCAFLLFVLFDRRVRYREDIADLTDIPVLGSIVKASGKNKLAIQANDYSPAAESFRSLRTNLDFFLNEQDHQVVVVTSTSIEEGKSFVSVNLGMSYALSGKKVLLIDFDLRNPNVADYLRVGGAEPGVGDFLAGRADLAGIVQEYEQHPSLHYISSGAISANPSELLMSDRLSILLEKLKSRYDILILDAPAVGLVSDGLRLARLANAALYIVRAGKTLKEDLKVANELIKDGKMMNTAIVFNGVRKGRTYKRALKKGYYQK